MKWSLNVKSRAQEGSGGLRRATEIVLSSPLMLHPSRGNLLFAMPRCLRCLLLLTTLGLRTRVSEIAMSSYVRLHHYIPLKATSCMQCLLLDQLSQGHRHDLLLAAQTKAKYQRSPGLALHTDDEMITHDKSGVRVEIALLSSSVRLHPSPGNLLPAMPVPGGLIISGP